MSNSELKQHGWVTPRPDGAKAKCGGPGICPNCEAERAELLCGLRAALAAGPAPLPYRWWTSCSFARLSSDATGKDGDVLWAVKYRDGACSIEGTPETLKFIEAACNAAPTLLAEVERLHAEIERRNAEPIEVKPSQNETAPSDDVIGYVARWGGHCRDCADENGVCPTSGLPCENPDKAIKHVIKALRYGVAHGYIADPIGTARPQGEVVTPSADLSSDVREAEAQPMCRCGDRPAAQCPGEWEPGCDLGANKRFAAPAARAGWDAAVKAAQPRECPIGTVMSIGASTFEAMFYVNVGDDLRVGDMLYTAPPTPQSLAQRLGQPR